MFFLELPFFERTFRGLMALLCQAIYPIIAFLYNLFINISKVNILSSDTIKPIYQRVTMMLTIIMIFYVTFEFVKFVVQPDGISDKEKGVGKIVYKMIAVVVLIALVPDIFTGAMKLQGAIVDKNVIGKVILGTGGNVGDNFGNNFSSQIFGMFYHLNPDYKDEDCDDIPCGAVVGMNVKSLRENGHLKYLTAGLNAGGEVEITEEGQTHEITTAYINFDGLFAVAVGIFIGYILILYSIDVGVRWAQLVYLQIIAPIPIIGYLSPKKDGIFQKWCKQCFTTYLDLFLRIAIIYFVLLICSILLEAYNGSSDIFSDLEGITGFMKTFVYIVLILGVMLFAQKAPKLIKELFPSTGAASGNFGLKAGERVAPMAARTIGAGLGATRAIGGFIGRGARTAARNRQNGKSLFTKQGRENIAESMRDRFDKKSQYNKDKKAYRQARRAYNATGKKDADYAKNKEAYENAQKKLHESRNAVAEGKNKAYRGVLTSAALGGIQGAWQGATTGAKATKLGDISKQVKAGYKKNSDSINAYEKYLDGGGSGGITGFVDRKLTQVGETFGVPSRTSEIEHQIKDYENQIKEQKQLSSVEGSIIKSSDQATDANIKKIEDGKLKQTIANDTDIANLNAEFAKNGVNVGKIKSGDKLADIYQHIKANAESKRAYADQLSKNATNLPADATDEVIQQAREAAEKAQLEAVQAEQGVKKGAKIMGEYTNTQILRDPNRNSNTDYEAGAVIAINTAIQRLKDASAQPSTIEKLKKLWTEQGVEEKTIAQNIKYIEQPDTIKDFEILDRLGKALSRVSATRDSDTQEIENSKNRLASGAYAGEVKSNVEYNNNGNKS